MAMMRIATLRSDPSRVASIASAALDIARLQNALEQANIITDQVTICDAWQRHSKASPAVWLAPYSADEDNVAVLLQHLDLHGY